jgi:hypothetical protein
MLLQMLAACADRIRAAFDRYSGIDTQGNQPSIMRWNDVAIRRTDRWTVFFLSVSFTPTDRL